MYKLLVTGGSSDLVNEVHQLSHNEFWTCLDLPYHNIIYDHLTSMLNLSDVKAEKTFFSTEATVG